MKHFLLACWFAELLTAQAMDLTQQLGKTVLYGDIAISPDGNQATWVQSTAATTAKQTYISKTEAGSSPIRIEIAGSSERVDATPAWSPDSNSIALFSNAGDGEQKQLWLVKSDGSG